MDDEKWNKNVTRQGVGNGVHALRYDSVYVITRTPRLAGFNQFNFGASRFLSSAKKDSFVVGKLSPLEGKPDSLTVGKSTPLLWEKWGVYCGKGDPFIMGKLTPVLREKCAFASGKVTPLLREMWSFRRYTLRDGNQRSCKRVKLLRIMGKMIMEKVVRRRLIASGSLRLVFSCEICLVTEKYSETIDGNSHTTWEFRAGRMWGVSGGGGQFVKCKQLFYYPATHTHTHTYTHTRTHTRYTHTHTHTHTQTHTHTNTHTHTHTHAHTHTHTYTHTHTHTHTHAHTRTTTHTHTHARTRARTHARTHTHNVHRNRTGKYVKLPRKACNFWQRAKHSKLHSDLYSTVKRVNFW